MRAYKTKVKTVNSGFLRTKRTTPNILQRSKLYGFELVSLRPSDLFVIQWRPYYAGKALGSLRPRKPTRSIQAQPLSSLTKKKVKTNLNGVLGISLK